MATSVPAKFYEWMLSEGDPRVQDWPLMATPGPILAIVLLYLVTIWQGPKLMANRKIPDLFVYIVTYNMALVLLSAYTFYEFLETSLKAGYSYTCQPVDYSNDPLAIRMANVCWLYFISKIIELIDTAFLILRKKDVSFLHACHHSTMPFNTWIGVKYIAGGQTWFLAMCNSFVHVVMYSYYGLSALGPEVQKYLWWKRYLTKLQLAQFVAVIMHTSVNMFFVKECDFPRSFNYAVVVYSPTMIALFANFYWKTYTQKHKAT